MNTFLLVLTSAFGEDPQKTFLEKLFPNFWDFLVQLIAFLILLAVVIKFGYKPISNLLKKRHDYIASNLSDSEKAKKEAEQSAKIAAASIEESKKTASLIVEEAKKEAEAEKERILESAKEDAKKEKIKANEDIELAKKAAKESIQKEIVDVAMKASSQLLGREVSNEDNKKLVEGFVSSLEDNK